MNICLIRPPALLKVFSFIMKPSPPLGLAFIAGALKQAGHHVTVIDAIAENPDQLIPFHKDIFLNGLTFEEILPKIPADTELIGLNLMFTCNWLSDRKLIDFLGEHFPGMPIIAGGEHITAIPELCITQTTHLTACVVGEGEETAVELLEAIENNRDLNQVQGIVFRNGNETVTTPRRKRLQEVEDVPMPAWEYFPLDAYQKHGISYGVTRGVRSLPLMATRGCPYSCTFCSSPLMWTTRYYMRSPEHVVDEISYLKENFGITNFDFFDLTAIIKKDWIVRFAQALITRDLDITWQIPAGTRSEAIDREVAQYLYKSGCKNITYAPESGSPEILKAIKKKVTLSKMFQSIRYSYEEKLSIKINIIIGFPEEHHRHIWQTIWLLIKSSWYGVHDIAPGLFSPYPGSELFNRSVKNGEIDVNSDDYFLSIFYAESFFDNRVYNHHMHRYTLRFYLILYIVAFYSSNYLFRPQRLFYLMRNVITEKAQTRTEKALSDMLKRKAYQVKEPALN
jgi:anaerobic magnesium-protoporphyrin IX monomethyl ester cyclase